MMDEANRGRLSDNWQAVLHEIAEAALASSRKPADIKTIGVSKYVNIDCTRNLFEVGCKELGESRPQVIWKKAESPGLGEGVQWHLIGHLQTNKVRRVLQYKPIIHSIDSKRLLDSIANESRTQGLITRALLEVNISGEDAKTGLSPTAAEALLETLPIEGVEIIGLMAMAGRGSQPEEARRQFDHARDLRDEWRSRYGLPLPELSMGMSRDYHAAIAAGATMVRIGSRLFQGILDNE